MNFIVPQNFNFKNKFLGLIDYPTLIFDFIYLSVLNTILNIFIHDLLVKLFSFNNESFIYVLFYIVKYYFSPRLYILNNVEK